MPFSTFLPFRRTTFAGTPTAVASAGMSEITTAPAPILNVHQSQLALKFELVPKSSPFSLLDGVYPYHDRSHLTSPVKQNNIFFYFRGFPNHNAHAVIDKTPAQLWLRDEFLRPL